MKPSAAALAGRFFTTEPRGKRICIHIRSINCMFMHNTNWEIKCNSYCDLVKRSLKATSRDYNGTTFEKL